MINASTPECSSNAPTPWVVYSALMAVRLIGLDKHTGVKTVGIGETWRRCFEKFVLVMAVPEAKDACRAEQLCSVPEVGIEGVIHAMRLLCQKHLLEEDWGFLIIDAHNALNKQDRTTMMWEVWYEWPVGAQFTFNCYCHWVILVIRYGGGTRHLLCSKEGCW